MSTSPFGRSAVDYLKLGLHPIPCRPKDKRPLVDWKRFQEEPPTEEELGVWDEMYPDANIALVLGRGIMAVDLDGGRAAETLLFNRGILLPGAPRTKTGSGNHVLLSVEGPVPDRVDLLGTAGVTPAGKKNPQVDIRGVGIIVAPPSVHPNGATYEWIIPFGQVPLPPVPETLLSLIRAGGVRAVSAPTATGGKNWIVESLRGVGEGLRDVTCTRLAGYFLGQGLDAAAVEIILEDAFAAKCTPPLDRETIRKCVRSIDRKESVAGDRERTLQPVHISTVLDELEASWKVGVAPSTRTPYARLNQYLSGGFSPGELIYLGARPGVGKTAMGIALARAVAMDGAGVIVVSREMLNVALARRMLAQDSAVPATDIRRRTLDLEQDVQIGRSLKQLRQLPVWMTDEAVSIGEIVSLVTGFEGSAPPGLLIVDYLQLVRAPREIRDRRLQVEAVSQALKTLAMTCKVPVLCMSSLSRPGKEQKDRRPTLDDLRESGELEHDADIVIFLHRKYGEAETECIVAKNREGATGIVPMRFTPETLTFTEIIK